MTIVCHWPILTFDGFMWDDVAIWKAQQIHDFRHLIDSFTALGKPHSLPLLLFFLNFNHPFIFMRIALLSFQYAIALLVFLNLSACLKINQNSAIIVSVIALTWPAMLINHMLIRMNALFFVVCFLIGCYCYINWLLSKPLKNKWIGTCLVFFGISFISSSTLVYFLGFWCCVVIHLLCSKNSLIKVWNNSKKKMLIHVSLLIYPVGFYFLEKKIFVLHTFYGGGQETSGYYNKPVFEMTKSLEYFWRAVKNAAILPLIKIGHISHWFLVFALSCGVIMSLFLLISSEKKSSHNRNDTPQSLKSSIFLTISGLILLFCGLFPYVAVGKPPGIIGVTTRHALLVALPMGLIIAGIYACLTSIGKRSVTFVARTTIVFLSLCFVALHFENYVDWQICAIKDKAIIEALKKKQPLKNVDLYIIRGKDLEGIYDRRWYDWGFIMSQAWGGFDRLAIYERQYKIPDSYRKHPLLGDRRYKMRWLMHWMGFGSSGSNDTIGLIELSPLDIDINRINKYTLFWFDIEHRFGVSKENRKQWLSKFYAASILPETYTLNYSKKKL